MACMHICTSILVLKAQCDAVNTCAWYQFDLSHNEESVPLDEALLYLKVTVSFISHQTSQYLMNDTALAFNSTRGEHCTF